MMYSKYLLILLVISGSFAASGQVNNPEVDRQESFLNQKLDEAQTFFTEADRTSNRFLLAAAEAKKRAETAKEEFYRALGQSNEAEKLREVMIAFHAAQLLEREAVLAHTDFLFAKAYVLSIHVEIDKRKEQKTASKQAKVERQKTEHAAQKAAQEYLNFLEIAEPFLEEEAEDGTQQSIRLRV